MQILKTKITIPKNHEIKIKIPDNFAVNENIEVIVIKPEKKHSEKIALLKTAMKDKAFLNDLKNIETDFSSIDQENWE